MQAEAHYNKIKAPFILHHQLYLHIFIKKRYSTIAQAATISFPKGVNASPASLKCWIPKGMPIMVMHSITRIPSAKGKSKCRPRISKEYSSAHRGNRWNVPRYEPLCRKATRQGLPFSRSACRKGCQ